MDSRPRLMSLRELRGRCLVRASNKEVEPNSLVGKAGDTVNDVRKPWAWT